MSKPLRLKKPKGLPNWYRSGRWHKIHPRPGRTTFGMYDLCQFKPDLLDVVVIDVLDTEWENVKFYRVRCVISGHEFSTYGNDLLLLERHKPKMVYAYKPKLVQRPKPKLVFKPKPVVIRMPPLPFPGSWKAFVPAPDVFARLTYWQEFTKRWVWHDFAKVKPEEVEAKYWDLIEEERVPPELVSIEWHTPTEKGVENAESNDQHAPAKSGASGGRVRHANAAAGVSPKQGSSQQPAGGKGAGKPGGSGAGKAQGNVPQRRNLPLPKRSLAQILKAMRRK